MARKKGSSKTHPCTIAKKYVPGCHELKIFSGSVHPELSAEVAHQLGTELAQIDLGKFADNEVKVKVNVNVRGMDVYVLQPTAPPTCDTIMELLLMISCFRRSSAKRVTAVIPYFAYRRNTVQTDFHSTDSNFIFSSASEVSKMLEAMGVDQVVVVDMKREGGLGFVDGSFFSNAIPVENIDTSRLCVEYYSKILDPSKELVLVFPTPRESAKVESIRRLFLQEHPNMKIYVAPIQYSALSTKFEGINYNCKGKNVLIVDHGIQKGEVLSKMSENAKNCGARDIYAYCTHFMGHEEAMRRVEQSALKKLVVTDTLPTAKVAAEKTSKIEVISISESISEIIRSKHFVSKD